MVRPKSATGDRNSYAGFCVTPNHKMFTHTTRRRGFDFVEAGKLPQTYYILQGAEFNSGILKKYFKIPKLRLEKGKRKNNKFGKKTTKFDMSMVS